jgi:DNA-binding LytR/AlgR family response regulator
MPDQALQCFVADDEDLAVNLLQTYIAQTEGLKLAASTTTASKVANLLEENKTDILFLDIQMPSVNGLQLAEQLANPPMIVFTTAYANYAVDGFRLHAIDYLLKPFSYERFLQAVDKCREYREYLSMKHEKKEFEYLFVKSDGRMVKIFIDEILFIEGWKQYVKIYTSEKNILTLESLKNTEDKLPGSKFIRVHKSYIVSLKKIEGFSINELHVKQYAIPIGRSYRNAVRKILF